METESKKAHPSCSGCGNYIDEEDLFCGNCGRETPTREDNGSSVIEQGFIGFDCETCGASMTYDAEAQGLRCAFCGSVTLKKQSSPTGRIKAESYMPFEVSRESATQCFEAWIQKGFFRPFGIKEAARVVSMRSVYVPCWNFRAKAHSYFAGDSSRTPTFARASWCPVFGERNGEQRDVLVTASGSLTQAEIAAIEPFDFERCRPYERDSMRDFAVEDFGLSRRGARTRARAAMTERERALAASEVPGSSRNVRINTLFTDFRSDPVLLPVWINAYRYKNETFRFLINGQTRRLTGRAPFSYAKLALLILAIAAVALVIAAVISKT